MNSLAHSKFQINTKTAPARNFIGREASRIFRYTAKILSFLIAYDTVAIIVIKLNPGDCYAGISLISAFVVSILSLYLIVANYAASRPHLIDALNGLDPDAQPGKYRGQS